MTRGDNDTTLSVGNLFPGRKSKVGLGSFNTSFKTNTDNRTSKERNLYIVRNDFDTKEQQQKQGGTLDNGKEV